MVKTESHLAYRTGQSVGRYRLVRTLAKTLYGSEHLAIFRTAGGFLSACRLLLIDAEMEGDHEETLDRLRPLLSLNHSSLNRIIDAGSADEQVYVAYEYQVGRNLAVITEAHEKAHGPLPPGVATHVATEVTRGLAYALKQARGVAAQAHGFIEPSSIYVGDDGQVRLMHFGLPRVLDPSVRALRVDAVAQRDAQAVVDTLRDLATVAELQMPRPSDRKATATEKFEVMVVRAEGRWRSSARKDSIVLLPELELVQRKLGAIVSADELSALLSKLFDAELQQEAEELAAVVRIETAGPGTAEAVAAPTPPPAMGGEEEWDPAPGTILASRYRIVRTIAEGGMGTVLEGEHLELGRRVAVKVLRGYLSGDPEFTERFRREARAACRIGHRNIVDIMDFGTTPDGRLFYVMELLDGVSFEDLLEKEGAIDQARAVRILLQLCDAVDAAHEAGVIHRDLKPDNLMLTAEGVETEIVRVVDFGIAHDEDPKAKRITLTGQIAGTPGYMSPEQVRGVPTDLRTDVYSAGIMLYEAITGRLPFERDSAVEVMGAHVKDPPPLPCDVAPERSIHQDLELIVLKAIEKKPEARYQSMADMAFDLWEVLEKIQEHQIARRSTGSFAAISTSFSGRPAAAFAEEDESPIHDDFEVEVDYGAQGTPKPEPVEGPGDGGVRPHVADVAPQPLGDDGFEVDVDIDALAGEGDEQPPAPIDEELDGEGLEEDDDRTTPSFDLGVAELALEAAAAFAQSETPAPTDDELPTTPIFDLGVAEQALSAAAAAEGSRGATSPVDLGPAAAVPPVAGGGNAAAAPAAMMTPVAHAASSAAGSAPTAAEPEAERHEGGGARSAIVFASIAVIAVALGIASVVVWTFRGDLFPDEGASTPDPSTAISSVVSGPGVGPSADSGAAGSAGSPSSTDLALLVPGGGAGGTGGTDAGGSGADHADSAPDDSPPPEVDAEPAPSKSHGAMDDPALAEARQLVAKRRLAKAARAYRELHAQYPDDTEIAYEFGSVQLRRRKIRSAERLLEQAVEGAPRDVERRLLYVRALARAGKRRVARRQCREILEIDPDNGPARRLLKHMRR